MSTLVAPLPARLAARVSAQLRHRVPPVERRERALAALATGLVLVLVLSDAAQTSLDYPYADREQAVPAQGVVDALPWVPGAFPAVATVGLLLSLAGVVLATRRPLLAGALAAAPFLTVPLAGAFVFASWWALAGVAVLAALRRVRDAMPAALLAVAVIAFWNENPLMAALSAFGQASPTGGAAGRWTVLGFAVSLAAAVAIAASVGAGLRFAVRAAAARAAERQAALAESVTAERARIARDLHDVVAHHVSLIAVRAESAPFLHPGLDDDARAVLADVAADARSALGELRQVLAVLQRSAPVPRAPLPGPDDVPRLVADARAAGQRVELTGAWPDLPPAVGHVLYRAVQEGLSNARRHAPGAPVAVTLTDDAGVVGLRIANATDVGAVVAGTGLAGMRERVESVGGALDTTVEAGRLVLTVTVPTDRP